MSEPHEFTLRRILVAIDLSPHGSAALEAAVRLAKETSAELDGLFIEDVELLRLAEAPLASEIGISSGTWRRLDAKAMEQALRRRAEAVRRAIAEAVRRTSLQWSFRISRGKVAETMLAESLQADLLMIGCERTPSGPAAARPTRAKARPILAVDESSPASGRLMDVARSLARQQGSVVVELAVGGRAAAAGKPFEAGSSCYVQRCSRGLDSLLTAVRQWQPQLVLIERASDLVAESNVDALLQRLPCPLVLVQ